jgi:UDP-3-O-acyl-N-acetylglucosamine deacetylase
LRFETVEHVLSALCGFGVTDAVVIVDGTELPIGDGSALPFIELLEEVGIAEVGGAMDELSITSPVVVSDGRGAVLTAVPSDKFWVMAVLDYSRYQALGVLAATYDGSEYKSSISVARTYGFHHELEALRSAGLGLGASLENVVALGDDGAPDPRTPFRMNDELVRHKILDMIGDFSLVGKKLNIGLVGLRPSHTLNVRLAKALLDQGKSTGEI